jgi:hypothetical protein
VWITEWRAIAARIEGLLNTGTFFFNTNEADNYNSSQVLIENAGATVLKLQHFLDVYGSQLPTQPRECLQKFLNDYQTRLAPGNQGSPIGFSGVTAVLTSLASFRAEFEYLIADSDAVVRSLVARAFAHLQRSIIADDLIQNRWKEALLAGETKCEALGACHLLAHGIWAFNTSSKGERTDLVLGERLAISEDTRRASEGLILTEWKVVRTRTDGTTQMDKALQQAKRYR